MILKALTLEDFKYPFGTRYNKEKLSLAPGEILRGDFMEPLGLSANALAKALHVPPIRRSGSRGTSHHPAVLAELAEEL